MAPGQKALEFQSWIMTEIHEQTRFATGCAKVIQDLCAMLIAQCRDGFDFENYLLIANEIWAERLKQSTAAVSQGLRRLRQKWNLFKFQLDFQALVIDRFEKPAVLIFVNLKACTNDGVTFFLIN